MSIFRKKKQEPETHTIYETTYTIKLFYKDGGFEEFLDVKDFDFSFKESGFSWVTMKETGDGPNTEKRTVSILSKDIVRREMVAHTKTITLVTIS